MVVGSNFLFRRFWFASDFYYQQPLLAVEIIIWNSTFQEGQEVSLKVVMVLTTRVGMYVPRSRAKVWNGITETNVCYPHFWSLARSRVGVPVTSQVLVGTAMLYVRIIPYDMNTRSMYSNTDRGGYVEIGGSFC